MRRFVLMFLFVATISMWASVGSAQQAPAAGPYKVLKTVRVGGEGGFDYVKADEVERRLYIPRSGPSGRILVFNLDTLAPVGEIHDVNAHGALADPESHHGFATSKPMLMFDTKTLAKIKTIDVDGSPDGILFDESNGRIYDFSHSAPQVTVIDGNSGSIIGTIVLDGAAEEAVSDGKGRLFIDIVDKGKIAVVDAKTLTITGYYDVSSKGTACAALAIDIKNHILFSACRTTQNMVILNSDDGNIIASLPIGTGVDGAAFNPSTMEVFSSQGDGTLTIIKENSPTSFAVEQTLQTMTGGKTLTLDSKTNRLFLIAAEYGPPPPPAADGRQAARGPMIADSFSILEVGK